MQKREMPGEGKRSAEVQTCSVKALLESVREQAEKGVCSGGRAWEGPLCQPEAAIAWTEAERTELQGLGRWREHRGAAPASWDQVPRRQRPARGDAGTSLARRRAARSACRSHDSPRVPNPRLTNYFTATFIDFL